MRKLVSCKDFSGKSLKHLVSAFVPMVGDRTPSGAQLLKSLCDYSQFMINNLPPRRHEVHGNTKPVIIFTDGAWEQGRASAGAVVVDGDDRFAFTVEVPQRLVSIGWTKLVIKSFLKSSFGLWCLSNGLSRIASLAGALLLGSIMRRLEHAPSKLALHLRYMRALARVIGDLEVSFPSMTWYERVCSFSNPSDLPSRGNVRQALVDYFLEDRGMIQGSDDLVDLVLQLTDEPYQVASTISGAKT